MDVRQEIAKFGQEGTAQKFNSMQVARRDMILKQRESGLAGVLTGAGRGGSLNP